MISQKKNLLLIQMLRGIASMLVVLLHINNNYFAAFQQHFLFNIFWFGGSGVDIFFVLSGFIITYSNSENIANPKTMVSFLTRRFVRIFPIYWILISLFLLLQLLLTSFYKTPFDYHIANIAKTYLLLPGHAMVNGVSWSLTNELFFYLLFTCACLIPNKKISFSLMITYLGFLIVFSLMTPVSVNGNEYTGVLIYPMNIEFFLGVLIAIMVERFPAKWIYPLLLSGIILFLAGAYMNNNGRTVVNSSANSVMNRVLLFGFPSFLIILSLVKLELTSTVKVNNIFSHLGDASYSIYLIHLPIVAAFFKIFQKVKISNSIVFLLGSCLLFVFVCATGIFIYHKIEKPVIKKLNALLFY